MDSVERDNGKLDKSRLQMLSASLFTVHPKQYSGNIGESLFLFQGLARILVFWPRHGSTR